MAHISVQLDQLYNNSLQIYENAVAALKQKSESKYRNNKKDIFYQMQQNLIDCVKHHTETLQLVACPFSLGRKTSMRFFADLPKKCIKYLQRAF